MGVGEFLGKLFGADAGKGETILRAYGKLPMYAEYRRLEVSPGAATAFTQWLDAGRLAWVNSCAKSTGTTRASRLMLRLPDVREWIVASIWDSRDTVGRVFPFCFFAVAAPEALGDDTVERFTSALALFEEFDAAHGELTRLGAGGDFYRLYARRKLALRPDDLPARVARLRAAAAAIDARAWFRSFAPDGQIDPALWFGTLVRRGQRWVASPELSGNLAISCPLVAGAPCEAQTLLWLDWIEPLANRLGRSPWLVMPAAPAGPGAASHLLLRDPMPGDFQLLTTDAATYGYVERIGDPPPASTETGATILVEPPTGSLVEWLKKQAPVRA